MPIAGTFYVIAALLVPAMLRSVEQHIPLINLDAKEMMMRKYILSLSAVAMSALIHTAHATEQPDPSDPDCHVNVNTDNGKGGFQVRSCKDETSIGFSGPIKDVDKDHPVGKGDAFIPKAGRDAQRVVQDVGHGVEHGTHEVGKVFAHVFGW